MKKLLTFTATIGIIVLGYYFYFHNVHRLQINKNEIFITSADIPPPFEGIRIVQISDLLVRSETCLELLENTIQEIDILDPEIIIFTGNLFSPEGLQFETRVGQLLAELDANLVKIAVLGYHDLAQEELVSDVLRDADFRILNNDALQVFNQSPVGINIIGINPISNRATVERVLNLYAREDRFNLLLMSVPTFATAAFYHPIHAQFSGHCLGTQDASSQLAPCFQFYNGTYQFADRFTLHVSSGMARFHTISGLTRQPSIDSFLLFRD